MRLQRYFKPNSQPLSMQHNKLHGNLHNKSYNSRQSEYSTLRITLAADAPMADSKKTIPDIPQLRSVHWASCDLKTGAAPLPAATHFVENLDKSKKGKPLETVLVLTKQGIISALFDDVEAEPSASRLLTAATRSVFEGLNAEQDSVRGNVEAVFEQLLRKLEETLQHNSIAPDALSECNGVVAWTQFSVTHVLTFGSAKARIFNNQLRLKNIKSLDSLGSYALDAAIFKAGKKIRDSNLLGTDKLPDRKPLQSSVFHCSYSALAVQGNDRIIFLIAPLWLPDHVEQLFRTAQETMNRNAACQSVAQQLRTLVDEPLGKVMIVDIVPHDPNMDLTKENPFKQTSQQTPKPSTRSVSSGKAASGLGKAAVAIAVVAAVGVAAYFGIKRYREQKRAAEDAQQQFYDTQRAAPRQNQALQKTDARDSVRLSQLDTAQQVTVVAAGKTELSLQQQFIIFDKLQKPVVPFLLRAQQLPDSTALRQAFVVTVGGAPVEDWTLRPDPSASAKSGKYWIFFKKPLAAGKYPVSVTYKKDSVSLAASSQLLVLSSELKSLRGLNTIKSFYGTHARFTTMLTNELAQILSQQTQQNSPAAKNSLPKQFMEQFSVSCELDNLKEKVTGIDYDEPFNDGPYIQANTKKIKVEIVWTYKPTGESITLATKETEPVQQPPSVSAGDAFVMLQTLDAPVKKSFAFATRKTRMIASVQNVRFELKNITIDFEDIPIDVVDQYSGKQIKAKLDNIEPFGAPRIDFENPETQLSVSLSANEEGMELWKFSPESLRVVETKYIKEEGKYQMTLEARGVPIKNGTEKRIITGRLAIIAGARLTNPNAGKAVTGTNTLIIPINLEY